MRRTAELELPTLFEPHPALSDSINRNVIQSEVEGGVHLRDVLPGTVLEVHTQNRVYTIVSQSDNAAWISGHPVYCPEPVLVNIHGSTWGGSMLWERFIGRGMHLEFSQHGCQTITTSRVLDVREKRGRTMATVASLALESKTST